VLLYRVFPHLAAAADAEPGHPHYLHRPQGQGRLDNPRHYDCWYLSAEAAGAVGEVFADLSTWNDKMFEMPVLAGSRRALGIYEVRDDLPVLDLDDARALLERGLRPTQVIARNLPVTQAWALAIFRETDARGDRLWDGVRWWSYHRPQWRIYGLWSETAPRCVGVEALDLNHPAVADAASTLAKVRS
jgi:RES domain